MIRSPLAVLSLCLPLALGVSGPARGDEVVGWRGDGTAVFDDATFTAPLTAAAGVRWSTPLPSWGNATPVRVPGAVVVTAEPGRVMALDAETGAIRWQVALSVLDGFEGQARAELKARLDQADADEAAFQQARADYSRLQREARRAGGDPSVSQRLAEVAARLDALRARLDGLRPYRTPEDKEIIGYATPTPVYDGEALYVLTGHGLLTRLDPADGTRVWARWLGPAVEPMRGYHTGHASSPRMVGGTLVVPYGQLRGVDPATGEDRWTLPEPWRHYGTPGVGTVGGVPVIATPGGRLVRATDGVVMVEDLAATYYVGPLVSGDRLIVMGNQGDVERGQRGVVAARYDLSAAGGTVTATERWRRDIPTDERVYHPPLDAGEAVVLTTIRGSVYAMDPSSGQMLATPRFEDKLPRGDVYPAPSLVGDRLYLTTYTGHGVVVDVSDWSNPTLLSLGELEEMRSSPLFEGDHVYLRTLERALRLGP